MYLKVFLKSKIALYPQTTCHVVKMLPFLLFMSSLDETIYVSKLSKINIFMSKINIIAENAYNNESVLYNKGVSAYICGDNVCKMHKYKEENL